MASSKKTPAKRNLTSKQKTKIDWFEARKRYLSDTTIGIREIAKEFGVARTTVERRAKSEGWTELRQELGEKAFNELTEKLVATKVSANDRHLHHYQNLQALANRSIKEMDEGTILLDRKGNPLYERLKDGTVRVIRRPINTFELEKLAKAVKTAIDGERVILGLPTSVSALTDNEGNSPWSGLAALAKEADKVIAEYESSRNKSSGGS